MKRRRIRRPVELMESESIYLRPNPYASCKTDKRRKYQGATFVVTRGKRAGSFKVIGCGTGSTAKRPYGKKSHGTYALKYQGRKKPVYVADRYVSSLFYRMSEKGKAKRKSWLASRTDAAKSAAAKASEAAAQARKAAAQARKAAAASAKVTIDRGAVNLDVLEREYQEAMRAEDKRRAAAILGRIRKLRGEPAPQRVSSKEAKIAKLQASYESAVMRGSPAAASLAVRLKKLRGNPYHRMGRHHGVHHVGMHHAMPARSSSTGRFLKRRR